MHNMDWREVLASDITALEDLVSSVVIVLGVGSDSLQSSRKSKKSCNPEDHAVTLHSTAVSDVFDGNCSDVRQSRRWLCRG